jgi:hypothetical protein
MPNFKVTSYEVELGRNIGAGLVARIFCKGEGDHSISVLFKAPGDMLSNNYVDPGGKKGTIVRLSAEYAWYLDLLRNEGPIYGHIAVEDPSLNSLSTREEPVSEGELSGIS